MRLTYWVAECLDDSSAYNVREKTRKACAARVAEHHDQGSYGAPKKVTVEYDNAFDLMDQCLGEGHGYWEA